LETDRHDITEILSKVALNTINQAKLNAKIADKKWVAMRPAQL
jgi:hypothetical protein